MGLRFGLGGVWGVGCGVWGLGFEVWGYWFEVQGFGGSGSRLRDSRCRLRVVGEGADLHLVDAEREQHPVPRVHQIHLETGEDLLEFFGRAPLHLHQRRVC